MICITLGPLCQLHEKEAHLLRDGYTEVVGPSLGPMQYCRQPEYTGPEGQFKLCWHQPSLRRPADSASRPSSQDGPISA
jgi:hypothetical protein